MHQGSPRFFFSGLRPSYNNKTNLKIRVNFHPSLILNSLQRAIQHGTQPEALARHQTSNLPFDDVEHHPSELTLKKIVLPRVCVGLCGPAFAVIGFRGLWWACIRFCWLSWANLSTCSQISSLVLVVRKKKTYQKKPY